MDEHTETETRPRKGGRAYSWSLRGALAAALRQMDLGLFASVGASSIETVPADHSLLDALVGERARSALVSRVGASESVRRSSGFMGSVETG